MDSKDGRRVYVPSRKVFGSIVKSGGILGIPSSYAILDDTGKRLVFVGEKIEFVYVDSSSNVKGENVEIPPDVVTDIRSNFSPGEAKKKIEELYSTDIADRETKFREYQTSKGTKAKPKTSRSTKAKSSKKSSK